MRSFFVSCFYKIAFKKAVDTMTTKYRAKTTLVLQVDRFKTIICCLNNHFNPTVIYSGLPK